MLLLLMLGCLSRSSAALCCDTGHKVLVTNTSRCHRPPKPHSAYSVAPAYLSHILILCNASCQGHAGGRSHGKGYTHPELTPLVVQDVHHLPHLEIGGVQVLHGLSKMGGFHVQLKLGFIALFTTKRARSVLQRNSLVAACPCLK